MHILIIDDEKNIRQTLSGILTDEGYKVSLAEDGEAGLLKLEESLVDLVFLDVKLPGMNGLDVLKRIKNDFPSVDVLMISGNSDINTAVQAVKIGAHDFMEKPLSLPKILIAVQNISAKRKLFQKSVVGEEQIDHRYKIIGQSKQITSIRDKIRRVAKTDARVLITGESGTGKELVAYAIHKLSSRSDEPFVIFNSAAIPKELVESELFGHEKGAFTGAVRLKPGKLETANHGTIFFDEIGDMNIDAQAKILRVLEEGKFERVGGNRTIDIDVRVLAATNRNIEEMAQAGHFREDLFYRLNVVPFYLPPLRERSGDIPLLLEHYLQYYARELACPRKSFTDGAIELLQNYPFPGNIRELKNLIERLYILSDREEIDIEEVRENLGFQKSKASDIINTILNQKSYSSAREIFERYYFSEKLKSTNWNISKLAEEIGIHQPNLSRKLKTLGISNHNPPNEAHPD